MIHWFHCFILSFIHSLRSMMFHSVPVHFMPSSFAHTVSHVFIQHPIVHSCIQSHMHSFIRSPSPLPPHTPLATGTGKKAANTANNAKAAQTAKTRNRAKQEHGLFSVIPFFIHQLFNSFVRSSSHSFIQSFIHSIIDCLLRSDIHSSASLI